MAPAIPDRWEDYKPVGHRIKGTRFIAFKVPLKEHISQKVESNIRLDGSILLKKIPNLGLIIDLTNTYRYYDPKLFQDKGVAYKKLMVPGRETPPKVLVDKFHMIVKEFMAKNKDNNKLIGVHCTHGVNRTGYFICNYMISQMNIEPNEALNRFNSARGHKIERHNYVDGLHKLVKTEVQNSIVEKKADSNNWRVRKEGAGVMSVYGREHKNDYISRNYYNDQSYRERPRDIVRNSYRNFKRNSRSPNNNSYRRSSRSKSPNNFRRTSRSPPPYYAHNNRRNDETYSYRRPDVRIIQGPLNLVPQPVVPGEEHLIIPPVIPSQTTPPPSRLRLNYYNRRPRDVREHNRHSSQPYTYKRNTHDL